MGDNVPSLRYFYFHILTTFVCNRTSQSLLGQIDTLYESVYWGKVHRIFQIHLRPEPVSHGLFIRTGVLQRDHCLCCSYFECFLLSKIHECSHEQDFIHLPLSSSAATTGFFLFHNFSCALRDLTVSFSLLFACKRLLRALFPSLPEASGNQWVLMARP